MTIGDYIIIGIQDDEGNISPVALCTDNSLSIDVKMEERASNSSAGDKEFIPGSYGWKMSSSHLVGSFNYSTLHNAVKNRQKLTILFHQYKDEPNAFSVQGEAYIASFKMSASMRNLAIADVEWVGTGELTTEDYSSSDYKLNWAEADNNDRFTFNNWN